MAKDLSLFFIENNFFTKIKKQIYIFFKTFAKTIILFTTKYGGLGPI